MATYLKITDGLQRSLGYLDEDNSLDPGLVANMERALYAAENFVQGAIGTDVPDFYISDEVKPLYTLACNSLAMTYINNPSTTTSGAVVTIDTVSNAIIGQLRGRYDHQLGVLEDGKDTKPESENAKN